MINECSFFGDFNYVLSNSVRDPASCELVVGEQYMMRVDGSKAVRVMLLTTSVLDEHNELRAHVVVLENNPYVRSGVECKPLAFTLSSLK